MPDQTLKGVENIFLLHKGHLAVYLGKFGLPVGPQVFIAEAAGYFRVSPSALERDLRANAGRAQTVRPAAPAPKADDGRKTTEEHLLFIALHDERLLSVLAQRLPHEWIDRGSVAGLLLDRLLNEALHNGWGGREQLDQLLENQEEKALVAALLFDSPDADELAKIANEGLRAMQRRFLEPRLRQIELEIASKGPDSDADLFSLIKQRSEMTRQLQNPPKITLEG